MAITKRTRAPQLAEEDEDDEDDDDREEEDEEEPAAISSQRGRSAAPAKKKSRAAHAEVEEETSVSPQQFQDFMKLHARDQKMHARMLNQLISLVRALKNAAPPSPATSGSAAETDSSLASIMAVRLSGWFGIG